MKRIALSLALLALGALFTQALAATLTLTTTNVLLLPPVLPDQNGQAYSERATSQVVVAGQYVRAGGALLMAAHAGIVTNACSTNTVIGTNSSLVVYTNVTITVNPVTVPYDGISGYDGTVRWYRIPRAREHLRLDVTIGSNTDYTASTVVLSTIDGDAWTYTASAKDDGLGSYLRPVYARKTSSNDCSIVTWSW